MTTTTPTEVEAAFEQLNRRNEEWLKALKERDHERYDAAQQAAGEAARELGAKLAEVGR